MSLRHMLQDKPIVGIATVAVLIAISGWMLTRSGRTIGPTYYDVQTGELFSYNGDELPPITAPSGGEGVVAHVFACGSCNDADARFIGYLEKYTEQGKAQAVRMAELIATSTKDNPPPPQAPPDRVIATYSKDSPPQWINANDPSAIRIVNQVRNHCTNAGSVVRCADQ